MLRRDLILKFESNEIAETALDPQQFSFPISANPAMTRLNRIPHHKSRCPSKV